MPNLVRTLERRPLAEFVRARRARLQPEEVGLAAGTRRRTPGLRREEVAHLAGVGVTWYTWFEQGRGIQVSAEFLERLCHALRLNAAERGHLFTLAQHRPPPHALARAVDMSPALLAMLASLPHPAYIKTSRWDIVAWNAAAAAIFGDYGQLPPERRNVLSLVFTDPGYRRLMVDWEGDARRILEKFRLDYARAYDDPSFASLVAELREASPEFNQWWPRQEVAVRAEGLKRFRHPEQGELELAHTSFIVEGAPDLRLVIYTPAGSAATG